MTFEYLGTEEKYSSFLTDNEAKQSLNTLLKTSPKIERQNHSDINRVVIILHLPTKSHIFLIIYPLFTNKLEQTEVFQTGDDKVTTEPSP